MPATDSAQEIVTFIAEGAKQRLKTLALLSGED
jgi:hypothetical protein